MNTHKQSSYWLRLWHQPRQAATLVSASEGAHRVALFLAAFFGALQSTPAYLSGEKGLLVFVPGALLGLCGLYLFSWLLRNFGRWFQASTDLRAIRSVMGVFLLPWILLFCGLLLLVYTKPENAAPNAFFPIFFLGFLYGYGLLLMALSKTLKITLWKTFFCLIITALVSIFPIILLAQLFFGSPGPAS